MLGYEKRRGKVETLVVNMKVPIETEPLISAPGLTFSKWLPLGRENGIVIEEEGIRLTLWFDQQASWWASQPSEEEIRYYTNVVTHYVLVEVVVGGVKSGLATYMQGRDFSRMPNDGEALVEREYHRLGEQIMLLVLNRVNRLVDYARAQKGQYWLAKHHAGNGNLLDMFRRFKAKGKFGDGPIFKFEPTQENNVIVTMPAEERYIREEEWGSVRDFVAGMQRPTLVLELLSGAEQLAGNGYSRSALTEAVTALEVAINTFGKSPEAQQKLAGIFGERVGVPRLAKQIDHLGLSGSLNYLLPILLDEELLPRQTLTGCQEAVAERQNVVHTGQRDVNAIDRYIASIRACCSVLLAFSQAN